MDNNLSVSQKFDPDVVNLAKAIRDQESQTNYNAVGDKGASIGAYQWNNQVNGKSTPLQKGQLPSDWTEDAKETGLDPTDFSPKNQDMVAYNMIKKYKDAGNNVLNIASIWNSGSKQGYDTIPSTKQYADSVYKKYLSYKQKTTGQS